MRLRFTGHETFIIRSLWLKKGYDFLKTEKSFASEDAVVDLGVGKNMVASIHFWMKAFGMQNFDTGKPTEIADFLFSENGNDPFLEDIGSIWLLHYLLIKTNYSSIYNLVFNELRGERAVFSKKQLESFIKRKFYKLNENSFNPNTIEKDISVFTRMYKKLDYSVLTKNFEDEINNPMQELDLMPSTIDEVIKEGTNKKEKIEWFYLHGEDRNNLPIEIILFSILDNFEGSSNISFRRLQSEPNSPGLIFLLNQESLYKKLKEIEILFPGVTLSETAGNVVFVLPNNLNKWDILKNYYAN